MTVANISVLPDGRRAFIVSDGLLIENVTGKIMKADQRKAFWFETGKFAAVCRGQLYGCEMAMQALKACPSLDYVTANGASFVNAWRSAREKLRMPFSGKPRDIADGLGCEIFLVGQSEAAQRIIAMTAASWSGFEFSRVKDDTCLAPGVSALRWPRGDAENDPEEIAATLIAAVDIQRSDMLNRVARGEPGGCVGGVIRVMSITANSAREVVVGEFPDRVGERVVGAAFQVAA